jgi:hypothetical protein
VNFPHHLVAADDFFTGEVAAAFRKGLVFDLQCARSRPFEYPHRMPDAYGIAEPRVYVDDERYRDRVAHARDVVGELSQREQPDVRHAEECVGDPGAGDIDRFEPGILDHAGGQRVRGTWQYQQPVLLESPPQ